jgi:hypothetical protein
MKINNLVSALIQSFLVCVFVFAIEFIASYFIKDFLQSLETFAIIFVLLSLWFYFTNKKAS